MSDETAQRDPPGRPTAAISEGCEPAEARILSLFNQLSGGVIFFFIVIINDQQHKV